MEEVKELQQDRLVLVDIRSNENHVLRQPKQLQPILLPLRTAWQGEQEIRKALSDMLEENSKWIQLYQVSCCRSFRFTLEEETWDYLDFKKSADY